jgi:hypothetical protein
MENRAAVFTSQPQAVEVYQAGAWWAGELLGWRHDADGSCQVWVRVVLGGVEETAWTDLTTLRLPERHLALAAEPSPAPYSPATREMSVARHPSGRRERSAHSDPSATASLPMVRDLSLVPDRPAAAPGGRRRAPEETSGGRRRAPEEAVAAAPVVTPAPSPGRHRAPADPGRHRTADTGLFPAVSSDVVPAPRDTQRSGRQSAADSTWGMSSAQTARAEEARSRDTWTAPNGLEPDLLTRPMRLSDHIPHARRPRVDGSLRGV